MNWGLGIGDWGLGPIPNPQSPIPKIQTFCINYYYLIFEFNKKIIITYIKLNNLNFSNLNE